MTCLLQPHCGQVAGHVSHSLTVPALSSQPIMSFPKNYRKKPRADSVCHWPESATCSRDSVRTMLNMNLNVHEEANSNYPKFLKIPLERSRHKVVMIMATFARVTWIFNLFRNGSLTISQCLQLWAQGIGKPHREACSMRDSFTRASFTNSATWNLY